MRDRLYLHNCLKSICPNVYYQPPSNIRMNYPCIVYSEDTINFDYADDIKYKNMTKYTCLFITTNPDDPIRNEILINIPYSSMNNKYISDGLYHNSITIYY